jgi:cytochrome c-type biogenesis protein CcmH/NrfG
MTRRDLLWFLTGVSMACVIGAVMLWVVFSKSQPNAGHMQASLPSWHPPAEATATQAGGDLHAIAEQMRRQRNYSAARDAYAALEQQSALTADEWADYADVVASTQNGSLGGEPARLIAQALKLNPTQPKGLWLQASLAHQQANYENALGWWKRLREQLPPDSPDQRIISANIAEATRLMAGNGGQVPHPGVQRAPELDVRLGLAIR